jgi:hypothetical protein
VRVVWRAEFLECCLGICRPGFVCLREPYEVPGCLDTTLAQLLGRGLLVVLPLALVARFVQWSPTRSLRSFTSWAIPVRPASSHFSKAEERYSPSPAAAFLSSLSLLSFASYAAAMFAPVLFYFWLCPRSTAFAGFVRNGTVRRPSRALFQTALFPCGHGKGREACSAGRH